MSEIRFRNAAHRDFFLESMMKCRVNDCYHRAFFYVMGIAEETRKNINSMFDFKADCIEPEGMHAGWQTSGTVKVCHLAFNLWNSPTEYAADKVSHASGRIRDEGIHQFNKQGQKNVQITRENIGKAKDKIADFKAKRAKKAAEQKTMRNKAGQNAVRTIRQDGLQEIQGTASRPAVSAASAKTETPQTAANSLIKTRQQGKRTIKTTARNAEKTVKTTAKGTVKATEKGVKTAKATSKTAIKTTEQTAKAAQKTAKASAKAAQKAAQTAKATAKATAEATKATVKATIAAVKAIIAGTKALISALIAGGWIAVVIILIVVLLGCAVSLFGGGSESTSYTPVSAEVEAYTPLIQKYAKQYPVGSGPIYGYGCLVY